MCVRDDFWLLKLIEKDVLNYLLTDHYEKYLPNLKDQLTDNEGSCRMIYSP